MNKLGYKISCIVLLSLSSTLLFIQCGTKKKLVKDKTPNVKVEESQPALHKEYETLKNLLIHFTTFEGKAALDFKSSQMEQSGDLVLKMKAEKEMWASVRALGGFIEVAQAFANQDSLFAVVRLTRSYYALSFDEGAKLIHLPLDFEMLQQFIIGNPVVFPSEAEVVIIRGKKYNEKIATYTFGNFKISLVYNIANKQLLHQTITKISNPSESIICDYDNYKIVSNQNIPLQRNIIAKQGSETYQVNLNFSTITLNQPVSYQFNFQKK